METTGSGIGNWNTRKENTYFRHMLYVTFPSGNKEIDEVRDIYVVCGEHIVADETARVCSYGLRWAV